MVASLIERILFEKILRPVFNMETHLDLEKSPTNPGKLSNAHRGLKRFLIHRLGRNSTDHEYFLSYIEWYNNGRRYLLQNAILKKDTLDKEMVVGIHDL
jgi:hypothetical protein